ncbi:hypothetical protein AU197_11635 [Mycobacterium sp. IS-1590]|nr:hypothetical protein AU197_11635 [Mycobacterium sp. IS-1590]
MTPAGTSPVARILRHDVLVDLDKPPDCAAAQDQRRRKGSTPISTCGRLEQVVVDSVWVEPEDEPTAKRADGRYVEKMRRILSRGFPDLVDRGRS